MGCRYKNDKKIEVKCKDSQKILPLFMISILFLSIISLFILNVDWLKLVFRAPEIGVLFYKLALFNFGKFDLIFSSFFETVSITLLSTFYSLISGLFFGMLAAQNVFRIRILSMFIKCFFTFLRAVPTPVWVLLMLVCLGFGPSAGIAGLCVHTTAFFTKSFSQSFEDITNDTIEALEVSGASKLQIFISAILPSSFTQIIAWLGMRFEINFAECAILGMVGAGGIGYVISSSLQSYDYGTAGLAILLVFLFAIIIERFFVILKKKLK